MLGAALLEVMDKEPSIRQLWIAALVLGGSAVLLARWSIVASLGVAAIAILFALAQHDELTDPFVGPAIRAEAGTAYFAHSYASMATALVLCAGAVFSAAAVRIRRRAVAKSEA